MDPAQENPYAPPEAAVTEGEAGVDLLRREHHFQECALQAMGVAHLCMALFFLLPTAGILLHLARGARTNDLEAIPVLFGLTLGMAVTGFGLLRLRAWGRRVAIAMYILFSFLPPAWPTSIPYLFLLCRQKAGFVCSKDYTVIRQVTEAKFDRLAALLVFAWPLLTFGAWFAFTLYVVMTLRPM